MDPATVMSSESEISGSWVAAKPVAVVEAVDGGNLLVRQLETEYVEVLGNS